MTPVKLPRSYELLTNIVASIDLVADGKVSALSAPTVLAAARKFAQELAMELWSAGQTERRVMAGDCDYDPPLWCKGESVEMVTKRIGVPWGASDPSKDHGRGRSYR